MTNEGWGVGMAVEGAEPGMKAEGGGAPCRTHHALDPAFPPE